MDQDIHESKDHKFIPMTSVTSRTGQEVTENVYMYTNQIVNISCFWTWSDDGR
ncbi:MAG TPA: hypothetical protein VF095_01130 [Bacillota bacterium]